MKPARTRALYVGSFDPITRGHLDIVEKALRTFDLVHIAVGTNPLKAGLFDVAERLDLIAASIADIALPIAPMVKVTGQLGDRYGAAGIRFGF